MSGSRRAEAASVRAAGARAHDDAGREGANVCGGLHARPRSRSARPPALAARVPVASGDRGAFQRVDNTVEPRGFENARLDCVERVELRRVGGA